MSNDVNSNLKEKYKWIMILHALGDTLGFKNGEWEFNHFLNDKIITLDYVNEMIYEFIELGGVNGIDLTGWHISDDTLFHLALAKAMLRYKGNVTDKFIIHVKEEMHKAMVYMIDDAKNPDSDKKIDRRVGIRTSKSVTKFSETHDARFEEYDPDGGGNGCAMRCLVIGMCLFGKHNRSKLVECSIVTSMLTHNNPIGYLGGYTSALFTAFALEKVPIEEWPYLLVSELYSEQLRSYLDHDNLDQIWDHNQYIRFWKKYIATKFVDNKPIKSRALANPMYRIKYYYDNFFKNTGSAQIGDSGYLCMIIAYDALLDCDGKWEKMLVYSILHGGDSDTIGAVAGGLYGAVYGKGDVPDSMLKTIEKQESLNKIASALYEKFV